MMIGIPDFHVSKDSNTNYLTDQIDLEPYPDTDSCCSLHWGLKLEERINPSKAYPTTNHTVNLTACALMFVTSPFTVINRFNNSTTPWPRLRMTRPLPAYFVQNT